MYITHSALLIDKQLLAVADGNQSTQRLHYCTQHYYTVGKLGSLQMIQSCLCCWANTETEKQHSFGNSRIKWRPVYPLLSW